jgi:cupin superfamily acireductone dioxygenase involved in methionine salvage
MNVEDARICTTCLMNTGMNILLAKKDDVFVCPKNPAHRFRLGKDGYLRSL